MKYGGLFDPMMAKTEEKFFLKLHQYADGGVGLRAVDESGNDISKGEILVITKGKLFLCVKLNPSLGYNTNCNGEIVHA